MYCKKRELSRRQARPCNHFNTKESHIVPTETLLDAAQRTLKCIDTHPPPTDTTHTRARRAHGCQLTHPAPYPVNPEPAHAASMAPQKCFFFVWRCTAESPGRQPESLGAGPCDASRSANKTALSRRFPQRRHVQLAAAGLGSAPGVRVS